MSLLFNTANYIETILNSCNTLFDIEILILCGVKTHRRQDRVTAPKNFVLWNSLVPAGSCTPLNHKSSVKRNTGQSLQDRNAATLCDEARTVSQTRPPSLPTDVNNVGQVTDHTRRTVPQASDTGQAAFANPSGLSSDQYAVPVGIASECLRMLLDASGFTSHRNCFQQSSYTNLSSKILVEALQKILKAESNRRKQGDESVDRVETDRGDVHTAGQPPGLKPKAGIIYMDLLPDHLRSSFSHDKVCAMVPMIRLSSSGKPSVMRNVKVGFKLKLTICNPNRNKKNQNFALLCILLQFTGEGGTCADVLRKYAKEGLSSAGCKRRTKFFTGPNTNCGGYEGCRSLKRKICTFYDEQRQRIGMGTVYPHCKDLNKYRLQTDEIVVRFGVVEKTVDHQASMDGAAGMKNMNIRRDQRTIWKTNLVSRINLHADYGAKVATEILVENVMPVEIREALTISVQGNSRNQLRLDVAKAIVGRSAVR